MISRVTAPATRTPVAATVAAVRTALATVSPDCRGARSAGCGRTPSGRALETARAPVAPLWAGAPAPAAARPGFGVAARRGLARPLAAGAFGFEARGGFAAAFPAASAFTAASFAALDGLPPGSRFSLRFPGR